MISRQPALTPGDVLDKLKYTARSFPTSGADNGPTDPTPVPQCQEPSFGVQQLQCYCTTDLCGAGMLDAGAAVAAATEVTPPPDSGGGSGGGGGGGLVSAPWVGGVALAAFVLLFDGRRRRPRPPPRP
jgi:serine protease